MRSRRSCILLSVAIVLISLVAATSLLAEQVTGPPAQEAAIKTATVTGRGATAYAAREDAIRQALQQTVAQLVVADRRIADDKVLTDRVMSTMNGYVTRFAIKNTVADGANAVVVTAEVDVSESRIEAFIGTSSAEGTKVDGASLGASLAADRLRVKARSEMLWATLDTLVSAISVTSPDVVLNPQDPERLDVTARARLSSDYLANLEGFLSALGDSFDFPPGGSQQALYAASYFIIPARAVAVCAGETQQEDGNYGPFHVSDYSSQMWTIKNRRCWMVRDAVSSGPESDPWCRVGFGAADVLPMLLQSGPSGAPTQVIPEEGRPTADHALLYFTDQYRYNSKGLGVFVNTGDQRLRFRVRTSQISEATDLLYAFPLLQAPSQQQLRLEESRVCWGDRAFSNGCSVLRVSSLLAAAAVNARPVIK